MKEFKYSGKWWLPEDPNNHQSGNLSFDPNEGAILELIGSFKKVEDMFKSFNPIIILGVSSEGKLVTLYKCHEIKSNFKTPGYQSIIFKINIILENCHFKQEKDIVFNSLSVNYSYLDEWVSKSGFKISFTIDKKNNSLNEYNVSYKYPEQVNYEVNNLSIGFDFSFRSDVQIRNRVNIGQETFIKVNSDKDLHFDNYIGDIFYNLQNFLSFSVGEPVYPNIIKGKNKNFRLKVKKDLFNYTDIFIYYPILNRPKRVKKYDLSKALFTFNDISKKFQMYINYWFKKSKDFRPVYDLYFAVLYNPTLHLNYKFLSLIQAIESYHRRLYRGKHMDVANYDKVKNKLINSIPKEIDGEFRTSLEQKIQYLNEYSLQDRLIELMKKYNNTVRIYIKDINEFIDSIVDTRNFLTHYDKRLRKRAKSGIDLYRLILKLLFVMDSIFLVEIKISDDLIHKFLLKNMAYRYPEVKKIF